MAVETKDYKLQENSVTNLVYDGLGKEVLTLHNERFRGVENIEDNFEYKEGQPIRVPNLPRVLSYNQILRERFSHIHVLSPKEVVKYWGLIPERDSTSAETDSIVFFPPQHGYTGFSGNLIKKIGGILDAEAYKNRVPIVISGLGVEKADPIDSMVGFIFNETEFTEAREAPYFSQDGKVSFNGEGLVQSTEGIDVCALNKESSGNLGRIIRVGSEGLIVGFTKFLNSYEFGCVQIIQTKEDN